MAAIKCPVHNFTHLSYKNAPVSGIISNYAYTWMRYSIEGQVKYGSLKSYLNTTVVNNQYAIETDEECPDGYCSTDNTIFTCKDRRGVIVANNTLFCLSSGHTKLEVFPDKVINDETICCIEVVNALATYKQYTIGEKFSLPLTQFKRFLGICKWIGKINTIECVGAEMIQWMSNDSNGYFQGRKVFDCRPGYGVLLRCEDIEMEKTNPEQLTLTPHGFIDLKDIYYAEKIDDIKKRIMKIGRRAEVMYSINEDHIFLSKLIYGTIKWMGVINRGICVGVELDFPCEDAMEGVISCSESFECESGHGVVCSIKSVTFDYQIYSVEFTVNDTFNIDFDIFHSEDWSQKIVKEKDIKKDENVFINIKKLDRIFTEKGLLKWCGYIQGVSVAVIEMREDFPITKQQKITKILKDVKPVAYITVATEYLFKYKSITPFKNIRDGIEGFDIGSMTKYGLVEWHGINTNNHLYYGFSREEPFNGGTNGTFCGQCLFDCEEGCGTLISVRRLRETGSCEIDESDKLGHSSTDVDDCMKLLLKVSKNHDISYDELLTLATKMNNTGVIGSLFDCIPSPVNIHKYPEVVTQLLESLSFDTLQIWIEKCPIEADNSKSLLLIAAEALKYGKTKLFESCMVKCTNKDVLMDNGETFITHIIKDGIDQSLIIQAIHNYEFDLSKANKNNCIPLTLACNHMMTDVMECILQWIKEQQSSNKMCSICMDRSITTVFNCGHNSCKECSENITQCHICKEVITSRGALYFN